MRQAHQSPLAPYFGQATEKKATEPAGSLDRAKDRFDDHFAARRESLTAEELRGVVDLLLALGTEEKRRFVLEKPLQALPQCDGQLPRSWDPRMSAAGNREGKSYRAPRARRLDAKKDADSTPTSPDAD